jgi:GNAT superfamily N-acetyltransferase
MLRLSSEPQAAREDLAHIHNSVDEFNMRVTQDRNYSPINIFLRDEDGTVQGGILADLWGGWMHITFLWVEEPLRKHGYGAHLLRAAEDEAQTKGCRHAFVETFSFQARPFYERFGYQVIAVLEDYPPGHTYYFLRKSL